MCDNAAPFDMKEFVYPIVKDFLKKSAQFDVDQIDILLTDDDFDRLMENPEIKTRVADGFVSVEDAVTIGVDIGFRIGMIHAASQLVASLAVKPEEDEIINGEEIPEEVVEVSPDEISYS